MRKINKNVVDYYRTFVKGNRNCTEEEIQEKLNKNINRGKWIKNSNGQYISVYGNMTICYTEDEILWIYSYRGDWRSKNRIMACEGVGA